MHSVHEEGVEPRESTLSNIQSIDEVLVGCVAKGMLHDLVPCSTNFLRVFVDEPEDAIECAVHVGDVQLVAGLCTTSLRSKVMS
jgi:hypothetical protein